MHDFFLSRARGGAAISDEVVVAGGDRLPGHFELDPRADVQVLAPMYRGPAGIDALNDRLRALLNPDGPAIAGTPLRVGDRVIQTRNSHELELMNGEIGFLEHHDRERERVAARQRRRPPLTLRYASRPRCASPTRSRSTRPRAAGARVVVVVCTAATRGC